MNWKTVMAKKSGGESKASKYTTAAENARVPAQRHCEDEEVACGA
jgi:hypothetical protein